MEIQTKQKRFSVKLNNEDKIEQLLQETYNLSCQQYNSIQNEINKIAGSTVMLTLDIDGKEKYAKIMANYISLQQKSITQKYDIAKLLSEIIKHKGDIGGALDATKTTIASFDISKLRELAKSANNGGENNEIEYKTKK